MRLTTIKDLANHIARNRVSLEKMFEAKGCEWDYSAKTFDEIGADMLDIIEVIMELEKIMDCEITDDLADLVSISNPNDLLLSVTRQRKLDDLGI
jgi:acyl carrier protein